MMILNTFALTAIVLTLSGVKALVLTQEKTMYSISSVPRSAGSSQSLSSADGVRVVCLAQGFRPDGATLSWSDNGNAVTGAEYRRVRLSASLTAPSAKTACCYSAQALELRTNLHVPPEPPGSDSTTEPGASAEKCS
ncbi:hypothetical protein HF521_009762 [Silurus meridionalis]|uniref:Ig-like domain-containing protein n=1 Tax=Silurus meridionalis TaxID=175797 RepID=A0A8T0BZ39_SILME|nr:hypothetical protein HF521_009762 [Silurus meridionalis]